MSLRTMEDKVAAGSPKLQICVVIASYNGSERLRLVLSSLLFQDVLPEDYEVVVVDNGSAESPARTVSQFAQHLRVRMLHEPANGLSRARNRGLREGSGDVIVFIDDDVIVGSSFISQYQHVFAAESVNFAGGPILPFRRRNAPWPWWFRGRALNYFSMQDIGCAPKYFNSYPYGANMAYRRSAILEAFETRLGRHGTSLLSGEEKNFNSRNGFTDAVHAKQAFVFHVVAEERLRLPWLMRRIASQIKTRIISKRIQRKRTNV